MEQLRAQVSLTTERDPAIHGLPPKFVSQGKLEAVLCVVQDTSLVGYSGTFFDESLWLEIVNIVADFALNRGAVASIIENAGGSCDPIPLDQYFECFEGLNKMNREPPKFMLVSTSEGIPLLCVEVEFWCRIGGPMPFHDSYTYVFFADSGGDFQDRLIQRFTRRLATNLSTGGYRNAA